MFFFIRIHLIIRGCFFKASSSMNIENIIGLQLKGFNTREKTTYEKDFLKIYFYETKEQFYNRVLRGCHTGIMHFKQI